jgi:hypothetical protein
VTRRGILLFAAMCVIWGVVSMIQVAVRDLAPVTSSSAPRSAHAAGARCTRPERPAPLARWRPLLAYTAIEVAIPWSARARRDEALELAPGLLMPPCRSSAPSSSMTGEREQGSRR